MANDKITRKDIVDDKVLDLGKDYAKSLEPAIEANLEWLRSFEPIKAAALEYAGIENQFKISNSRKEFLEIKAKEIDLQKKTSQALKAEQDALLKLESVENKRLANQAKQIDIANKQLTLSSKEEAALKRKTKLSATERVELQQRNKQARQLAIISSSLSTAYERESARLVLLTRKYKDAATQYGTNSKEARKFKSELDGLDTKLKSVDAAAGNFQRNVGNYPRGFAGAISSIKQLASAAGLLGGAFLAIQVARDATQTIIQFDRQLIAVRKTTNLTKEETSDFSKEVIQLGLNLEGISIQGLLQSSEIAGQLGIRGSDNILKFSKTLEQLKLTSDIAGEEAAQNFAKFIEVSSDSVENADRLGSVITDLGNNFATTESQILKNTIEIQKGISTYDASAQSVIGLGAATSALGGQAESSKSALQQTFKVLNDGAATGKNLNNILKLTGQTAEEFRKEFATNSVETFRKFIKGLSDSEKAGKNLTISLAEAGIQGKISEGVIGSLAKNYETLEEALTRANDEYINNEVLTNEANQAAESLESNIADLADTYDALILSLESGDGKLSNAFKGVVGFIEGAIKGLIEFNETFDETIAKLQTESKQSTFEFETGFLNTLDAKEAEEFAISQLDRTDEQLEKERDKLNLLIQQKKAIEESEPSRTRGGRENNQRDLSKLNVEIESQTRSVASLEGRLKAYDNLLGINTGTIKTNNTSTKTATELAEEKAKADAKATAELERANKALLRRRQLEKDSSFKLESSRLNTLIKEQEAIIKNEKSSFSERYKALQEQAALEIVLARATAQNKFDIEKNFSDGDIEALLTGGQASAEALKKISDEELLIIEEYQAKRNAIQGGLENSEDSLELDRIKSEAETKKAIQEKALNDELVLENEAFQKELAITDDREKAIEAHEIRIANIKKKYALEALDVQVLALKTLIAQSEEGSVARIEAERKLSEAQLKISQLNLDAVIGTEKEKVEAVKLSTEEILGISSDLANALNDLASAIFDARIQKIDDEITANDEKYDKLLSNELLTDARRKELEAQRQVKEDALNKKKAKEQRKQAILAKATAALTIGLQTASAIIGALAAPPVGLGPIAGIPFAAAAGVIGAVQLAAALAAPIPKYALGTEDHPGGVALVGEGLENRKYVPEWVKEPNKKPYLVSKPTLLDLPKHTKVTPTNSLEDYQALMRASILSSVDINNKKLNNFQANVSVNNNYDELVKEMQLTRAAIKNQKRPIVNVHQKKIDINHAVWAAKNRKWHD